MYQSYYSQLTPAGLVPYEQGPKPPMNISYSQFSQPAGYQRPQEVQRNFQGLAAQVPHSSFLAPPPWFPWPNPPQPQQVHSPLSYPIPQQQPHSAPVNSDGPSPSPTLVEHSTGPSTASAGTGALPQKGPEQEKKGLQHLIDAPEGQLPGYSIKALIEYAIKGSPTGRLSLNDIYIAIEERYPIYKAPGSTFRNSARHDISMDNRFVKSPRLPSEPGKGNMWTFDPTRPPKQAKPRKKKKVSARSEMHPDAHSSSTSIIVETPQTVEKRTRAARLAVGPYKTRSKTQG
ncbi:hypothetical protein FRC03_007926 [Tulasnella sp. 419]|nr:hypothetical protein FRC03_007926 [Tulasnella sp. 419]